MERLQILGTVKSLRYRIQQISHVKCEPAFSIIYLYYLQNPIIIFYPNSFEMVFQNCKRGGCYYRKTYVITSI